MSDMIETHRVKAYKHGIDLLAQQKKSRLRGTVMEPQLGPGKIGFWDQIGSTSMATKSTRHGSTTTVEVPTDRRSLAHVFYETAHYVDRNDITTVINNPTGKIGAAQAAAMGRNTDEVISDAFFAAALTGEDGGTSTAFPTSTHQVAGGGGLTTAKCISAKRILDENEVDDGGRTAAVTAEQLDADLLTDSDVKSADFNTIRALVNGDLSTWLGFKFVRYEGMPLSVSDRSCAFYQRDSMAVGIRDVYVNVTQESTNSYMWQVYLSYEVGASRADELGVVEVVCVES